MSRWGKNIVVPLESLHKEKENNNRPTVARSVGTVGKWGKMGFTSTRTYALSALPAAVAAAAAAAAASTSSPGESPGSLFDDDMSISIPEPPKPKKFFKSRNTAPPEVIAQIIQQLPRPSTSPIRDQSTINNSNNITFLNNACDSIKINTKTNSVERKKKPQKKATKQLNINEGQTDTDAVSPVCQKQRKKKEDKKLKPETPPSRIISRARKTVNYCEDEEEDRISTPLRDIVISKNNSDVPVEHASTSEPVLPPPAAPLPAVMTNTVSPPSQSPVAPKTPEHPPIVLRISKGTSRLVSTDSEEQQTNSPQHDLPAIKSIEPHLPSRHTSVEESPALLTNPVVFPTTPKIIVKPPKPPSPLPLAVPEVSKPFNDDPDEPPEINYCTVKISPDKPPKERLKLIIKTDVIRNAIAAAAAAEKAKAAAAAERATLATSGTTERHEKERKQKNRKHKHYKHAIVEQLTPAATGVEFKIPSPHLALGNSQLSVIQTELQQSTSRSVISPPALSERDFDSQSSVLGSISSKGNSTPLPLTQAMHEESCVIHSRGSSVITSDLETSQHSSLVAPPSEIELRLESMMEGALDGEDVTDTTHLPTIIREEPLQGDILDVLRGDETLSVEDVVPRPLLSSTISETMRSPLNDQAIFNDLLTTENVEKQSRINTEGQKVNESPRRVSRRRTGASRTNYAEDYLPPAKVYQTRGRRAAPLNEEMQKRPMRRTIAMKKTEETFADTVTLDTGKGSLFPSKQPPRSTPINGETDIERRSTSSSIVTTASVRRCRSRPNTGGLSNNNIINRIAADLSAKAGAAEEAARITTSTSPAVAITAPNTRSYGRKRKNQQVTQVLQPPVEAIEHIPPPIKIGNLDDASTQSKDMPTHGRQVNAPLNDQTSKMDLESNTGSNIFVNNDDNASPPRRDYRIKDKFKRTLMLDHQPTQAFNCNTSGEGSTSVENGTQSANSEETEQRAAVKLVISKKKGSIFKSRALVPDQPEQAAAKRSHLYKHRWNVEPSGGSGISDGIDDGTDSNIGSGKHAVTRSINDAIFDGFTEDFSEKSTPRTHSPSLGRITRTMRSNPQTNNTYEMNTEFVGGSNDVVTNARIDRNAKEYYTVVRNVKTAHRIQEIGEYQEMDDDVEYILDALQPHNPTPTRCLSALQLAAKCMTPAFRMHVRAHGIVTKFFKALSDANTDLSLGLCTTAIMYILSQEGLNMDLDRDSLELMMNLLEAEEVAAAPSDHANYERNKQKVRELCEEIKAQGKATHLNVDSITVGTLAMETFLSLTSKRAGEWFKEELRELGGLEHIIKTISDCCCPVINESNAISSSPINWAPSVLDNMRTVERCMRVMENVTQMNEENQKYLLSYANGAAVNTLSDLYRLCSRELILYPTTQFTSKDYPGIVIRELLIPLMKVLINMTHTFDSANPLGSKVLEKRPDVIETSFRILLQVPHYVPDHAVFELNILVLLLLINLTMYSPVNRMHVMTTFTPFHFSSNDSEQQDVAAIKSIMDYFYKCEELARLVEKNTDAILDCSDKNKKKQEEVDETVNNLLQKAGHHMEHTMKGSYAAILIGHLITDNEENEAVVRTHLRDNGFKQIISVLEKYYTFMNLTASSEASVVAHIKSTKKLIDYFKKRDLVYQMNDAGNCVLPINTSTGKRSPSNTSPTPVTRSAQRVYKTYSQR